MEVDIKKIASELNEIDEEVELAHRKLAEFDGQKKQLFKQAEEEFDLKTVEEMELFLDVNKKAIEEIKIEIKDLHDSLMERYNKYQDANG